jgi:hypothetical protein
MNIFRTIALYSIFGKPLVVYLGLTVLTLFIISAIMGSMILKGKNVPLKYHLRMAKVAIAIALIHGFLAFSIFLK